jgi:transcriptional regulator with XRE-family HTH domain
MDATVLHPPFQEPEVRLTLRRDNLKKFRRLANLEVDAHFAERIDVHPGQLSKVLHGKSAPGTRFIAGCLQVFGVDTFADLFALAPDEDAA